MKSLSVQQAEYQQLCKTLTPLCIEYLTNEEDIIGWSLKIDNYKAYIPLIGCYGAGKSSILNTLLGKRIFKCDIGPVTDIAFEMAWGEQDKLEIRHTDGVSSVTFDQIREGTYTAKPDSVISLELNNDNLKAYPHLALVDLPGLNAGIDAHSKAVDSYISKSAAYLVIIDPRSTLRKDLVDFLSELSAFSVPVYCLITKSDKITEKSMQEIKSQVSLQIKSSFGREADDIGVTSGMEFENNVTDLHRFMESLEKRSGEMMSNQFNHMFMKVVRELEQVLSSRIENEQLADAELDKKEHEQTNICDEAIRKLKSSAEHQQSLVLQSAKLLLDHIQQALESNASSLASSAVSKIDVSNQIRQIYSRAFVEGYQTYIIPMLKEYSKELSMLVPDIQIGQLSQNKNASGADAGGTVDNGIGKIIATEALAKLALAIPVYGPFIAAAIKVFGYLSALFGGNGSSANQEGQKQQVQRQIEQETIPQIIAELQNPILEKLNAVVAEMNQYLQNSIKQQTDNYNKSLEDIKISRQKKTDEFEAQKQKWQKDLIEVRKCYDLLS